MCVVRSVVTTAGCACVHLRRGPSISHEDSRACLHSPYQSHLRDHLRAYAPCTLATDSWMAVRSNDTTCHCPGFRLMRSNPARNCSGFPSDEHERECKYWQSNGIENNKPCPGLGGERNSSTLSSPFRDPVLVTLTLVRTINKRIILPVKWHFCHYYKKNISKQLSNDINPRTGALEGTIA
jgi:hypothetical protein